MGVAFRGTYLFDADCGLIFLLFFVSRHDMAVDMYPFSLSVLYTNDGHRVLHSVGSVDGQKMLCDTGATGASTCQGRPSVSHGGRACLARLARQA